MNAIIDNDQPSFAGLALKTSIVHTITYFLMGVIAYYSFDYAERFARPEMACWMRQTNDPWVNHAEKKWLNWVMGVVFFLLLLMTVAGLLTRPQS